MLYSIDKENDQLIQINTQFGKGKIIGSIGFKGYGLAFDSFSNVIYSNNRELIKIDPVSGKGTLIGPIGFETVRSMAFDSNTHTLYGVNTKDNKLIKIDTRTGTGKAVDTLRDRSGQPLKLCNFGLTFNPSKNLLYGSTTIPLIEIDPVTAKSSILNYKSAYDDEKALYLKYVYPMINIKRKLDLTYLYTCILIDKGEALSYVIDASQDETHSFVGSEDVDKPEEKLKDVWLKGNTYLSDIKYWEEWGLLKSAYSPIFDSNGEVKGIAGTDVNISVIKKKTRSALSKACLIGLFSLVIGIWVSVYITRRLTKPIGQLTDIALRVAAGQYGDQIKIDEPLELGKLSIAFNDMSQSLKTTFSQLARSNQELESKKCHQELMRILARKTDERKYTYPKLLAHGYFFSKNYSYNSSGWINKADKFIMWLADSSKDDLKSVKTRHDIYEIIDRLYDNYSEDWIEFKNHLKHLFNDSLYCLCLIKPKDGTLKAFVRRSTKCIILDHSGGSQVIELSQTDTISLKNGQVLVISSLNLADLLTNTNILSDFIEITMSSQNPELDAGYLLSVLKDLVEKSNISHDSRDDGIVCLFSKSSK